MTYQRMSMSRDRESNSCMSHTWYNSIPFSPFWQCRCEGTRFLNNCYLYREGIMRRTTTWQFALEIGGTATAAGQFCQYHRLPTEWYSLAKARPISGNEWQNSVVDSMWDNKGFCCLKLVGNFLTELFAHSWRGHPANVCPELCSKPGIIPGLMHACFQGLSIRPVRCFRGMLSSGSMQFLSSMLQCFWAEYAWHCLTIEGSAVGDSNMMYQYTILVT